MPASKTHLEIVFGAMTFGRAGEEQVRTSSLEDCAAILDTFQAYGHNEIDTSRFYGVRIIHSLISLLSTSIDPNVIHIRVAPRKNTSPPSTGKTVG